MTTFNLLDYEPGDHTLIITALDDATGLSETARIPFVSPARLDFTCQETLTNTFDCETLSNEIESISCSLAGYDQCDIPLSLSSLRAGEYTVTVSATDSTKQTVYHLFQLHVPLFLSCTISDSSNGPLLRYVSCEGNTDNIACLYDGQYLPSLPCKSSKQYTDTCMCTHTQLMIGFSKTSRALLK